MFPRDEAPRSGADGSLAEGGGYGRRHDRRDGHREELRENRQRLGQRERDRGVPQDLDAAHIARASVREFGGSRDRQQRPHPPAMRRGIEDAPEGAFNIRGDQRSPVMKADAGTKMEDVPLSFSIGRPAVGEAGQEPAIGVELRESVEEQRHHLARRHVGGECRVERARIVGLVIDEAARSGLISSACPTTAGGEKTQEQGALRGVEKVDSAEQVSQHSRDCQTTSIARHTLPVARGPRSDNRPRRSRTGAGGSGSLVRR